MATENSLSNLRSAADSLATFNADSLRNHSRIPRVDAQTLASRADALIRIVKVLNATALDALTDDDLDALTRKLTAIRRDLDQLLATSTVGPADHVRLNEHCSSLAKNAPEIVMSRILGAWPELEAAHSLANTLRTEREAIAKLQEALAAQSKRAQADHEASERQLQDVKRAISTQGLEQQAAHFADAARGHERSSIAWLVVTLELALFLAVLVADSVKAHDWIPAISKDATPAEVTQAVLARLLIFGAATSFLFIALRQFGANRHNVVVNRHRENALKTYQALRAGATDPKVRDIILTQAASCIFAPQSTGFTRASGGESENAAAGTLAAVAAAASKGGNQ